MCCSFALFFLFSLPGFGDVGWIQYPASQFHISYNLPHHMIPSFFVAKLKDQIPFLWFLCMKATSKNSVAEVWMVYHQVYYPRMRSERVERHCMWQGDEKFSVLSYDPVVWPWNRALLHWRNIHMMWKLRYLLLNNYLCVGLLINDLLFRKCVVGYTHKM